MSNSKYNRRKKTNKNEYFFYFYRSIFLLKIHLSIVHAENVGWRRCLQSKTRGYKEKNGKKMSILKVDSKKKQDRYTWESDTQHFFAENFFFTNHCILAYDDVKYGDTQQIIKQIFCRKKF